MKKKNKNIIIVSIVILILIIGISYLTLNKPNPEKNQTPNYTLNSNEKITKDEEFKGLKFNQFNLLIGEEQSTLNCFVTNETKETISIKQVKLEFLDKENQKLGTMIIHIGDDMKPGETRRLNASTGINLKKATDKTIK